MLSIKLLFLGPVMIITGLLVTSMSDSERALGMEQQAIWRGPLIMLLGVVLIVCGFKFAPSSGIEASHEDDEEEADDDEDEWWKEQ